MNQEEIAYLKSIDPSLTDEEAFQIVAQRGPIRMEPEPAVQPNGVPTSVVQAPQDQLLQMVNNPERQALMKQISEKGQQAIDEQKKGIAQNEGAISQLEKNGPDINYQPLNQYVDALTGSNFASGYQQPESAEARKLKLLGLKNTLQTQRQGLSKEQIDLLKNQLSLNDPMKIAKELAQMKYYNRYEDQGPVENMQQKRQDYQEYNNLLKSIDTDKTNTQRLANYSNLSSALTNFTNASIRSPNQLAELEQVIRSSLGTKGTGGVEERDKTYLNTFERAIISARQYWESNPQDVQGIQTTINHLKEIAANEQNNFRNQVQARWKALIAGHEGVFKRNHALQESLQNKINASLQQFNPPEIKEKPRNAKGEAIKESSGPAVGTVEDGHKFLGGDPAEQSNWELVK